MNYPTLDSAMRRALRAQAHHLDPVVMIASKGLTPAVLAEIDRALTAHELIKIRVAGAERSVRAEYLESICATLGCAPVQMLGNLLIVWRPNPERAQNLVHREGGETERREDAPKNAAAHKAHQGGQRASSDRRNGAVRASANAFVARARRLVQRKGHS